MTPLRQNLHSKPLQFRVSRGAAPSLLAPVIVEAENGKLDPAKVPQGATVRIGAEALIKVGDKVVLQWRGNPGPGTQVLEKTATADGQLELIAPHALVLANDGALVQLDYSIVRQAGGTDGPSATAAYDVKSDLVTGSLRVMGARWSRGSYRASGNWRLLSALDANTGKPLAAQWQYAGDTGWSAPSTTWRDTDPSRLLRVQTANDLVILNTPNLIGNGVDTTTTGEAAFVAHRDSGDMIGWGNPGYGGSIPSSIITMNDINEVSCTGSAFAGRTHSGQVVAWGNAAQGGVSPVPSRTYTQVCGNSVAFAAINDLGAVVAWGTAAAGATVPDPIKVLTDLRSLAVTGTAFAAIRQAGEVVAWGNSANGGSVPSEIGGFRDIKEVLGANMAFAAWRGNGRLVAWGSATAGGQVPGEIAALTDIVELSCANAQAFTARRATGQVVAWGNASYGGTLDSIIGGFTDIVHVVSTWQSFAALRGNGHVVAWGGVEGTGGVVPPAIAALDDIIQVAGSSKAFAALRKTGQVVAWGLAAVGGTLSAEVEQLTNVIALYANSHGFAALTADSRVITWGQAAGGGDNTSVRPLLNGKVSYLAKPEALARAMQAWATRKQG
ncbi:RCC1 domain-containing protein [Pseudomonas oryziphila]|uniref:Alpha-tubulin suppressor n=1 Tax=Pseudomonas oryziphila TaxID=2894079 RepID=A0ABM7CN06_9PSED|nr:hypothetical protein [Pseudomonas oryziphila]AZL72822.1 hypothetical protein EI693_06830 [Pseudomonas oryziphila]